MKLKCGPNNFDTAVGGGGINANVILAIIEAFVKFIAQLADALKSADQFVKQDCPDGCPKKAVTGPAIKGTGFSLKFSPKKGTWQAGFRCVVVATVQCR